MLTCANTMMLLRSLGGTADEDAAPVKVDKHNDVWTRDVFMVT